MYVFKIGQKDQMKWARVFETLIITSITLVISFYVSTSMPCNTTTLNATEIANIPKGTYPLHAKLCPGYKDNHYQGSGIATILLESREEAIKVLFTKTFNNGVLENSHLAVAFVLIFCLTLITYGCTIPAGLFIPNIMCGACFGRIVGQLVLQWFPNSGAHPGVYALMGAAGMLGGFSRMTVSLAVIVLEITTNMLLVIPIMLVIMTARMIGNLFTPSAYDIVVALKGVPLLEPEAETLGWIELSTHSIASVGVPVEKLIVVYSSDKFKVSTAVDLLTSTRHHAWPVLNNSDENRIVGLLTRTHILDSLEKAQKLPQLDANNIEKHALSESALEESLNIWPFVNRHPHTVIRSMPFRQAYRMFRTLGLRHLMITDERHTLVALVTRTDLVEIVEQFAEEDICELRDYQESVKHMGLAEIDDRQPSPPTSPKKAAQKAGEQGEMFVSRNVSKEISLDGLGYPERGTSKEITRLDRREMRGELRQRAENQNKDAKGQRRGSEGKYYV